MNSLSPLSIHVYVYGRQYPVTVCSLKIEGLYSCFESFDVLWHNHRVSATSATPQVGQSLITYTSHTVHVHHHVPQCHGETRASLKHHDRITVPLQPLENVIEGSAEKIVQRMVENLYMATHNLWSHYIHMYVHMYVAQFYSLFLV